MENNFYEKLMNRINEAVSEYIVIPEGKPTSKLEKYKHAIEFCKANFSEDECDITIDDPEKSLRQHIIDIEWKVDIFGPEIKGKIIALLLLADEFFQSGDSKGNISWSVSFFDTYEE